MKRAILVADNGSLSRENISLPEEEFEYIVGTRLRSFSNKWQDKFIDNEQYIKQMKDDKTPRISEYQFNKTIRLIAIHSDKRALKDRKDRD